MVHKKQLPLKEYYIILKKDHTEIGLSDYKLKQYQLIENDDLVVITTNDKSAYEEACKWLNKVYYWREHNAFFSHDSEEYGTWFSIENGYVKAYSGSI